MAIYVKEESKAASYMEACQALCRENHLGSNTAEADHLENVEVQDSPAAVPEAAEEDAPDPNATGKTCDVMSTRSALGITSKSDLHY